MNSKQASDRMEEIEYYLTHCKVYRCDECAGLKQEAKEIYEKFKDGCKNVEISEKHMTARACGLAGYFCPNCQRIHKSLERIWLK